MVGVVVAGLEYPHPRPTASSSARIRVLLVLFILFSPIVLFILYVFPKNGTVLHYMPINGEATGRWLL
jgi:hypothetical protein